MMRVFICFALFTLYLSCGTKNPTPDQSGNTNPIDGFTSSPNPSTSDTLSLIGEEMTPEPLLSSQDIATVKKILSRLIEKNEIIGRRPQLIAKSMQGDSVAYYRGNNIVINSKLTHLCKEWFNKEDYETALAIILGHELHHHQSSENCVKTYGFVSPNAHWRIKAEHDADLGGLYYAIIAGYSNVKTIAPILLENIYQDFKLPTKQNGYKDLPERKQAYTELAAKADTLSRFFMLGNVMMGMRQFDMAEEAFGHILNRGYKVKEVRLHQILASLYDYIYPNGNQIKEEFIFPLELELTIGMNAIEPIDESRSSIIKRTPREIIARLDSLGNDYPNYSKVQFYLAICHALAGNTSKVSDLKNGLPQAYQKKMELIQALAALKKDKSDTIAKATLARMSEQASNKNLQKLAAWNLQVLEGQFPYDGNKVNEPCPFTAGKSGYTRKYGKNTAGIEWEENNNGQQIYSFWRKGSSPYTYVKSRIKFSASETKKLLPTGSNIWIMPGCTRMMFESTENGWYRWDLFF